MGKNCLTKKPALSEKKAKKGGYICRIKPLLNQLLELNIDRQLLDNLKSELTHMTQ